MDIEGLGFGATGRRFSFWLAAGLEFEFRGSLVFALPRGVTLALSPTVTVGLFALGVLFAFADLLALPFPFSFAFSFLFFGRLGLFSLVLVDVFVLGVSSGLTVSGASPSLVARLMSIATVCPALTTSPGRGN